MLSPVGKLMGSGGSSVFADAAFYRPFATSKSLTGPSGPVLVVTQAQETTYWGEDGLLKTASANEARFHHDQILIAIEAL